MKNEKNIIVYFGIIQYEFENAMCQRAEGIKKLISSIGYTPLIIGVNSKIKRGEWRKKNDLVYEINGPSSGVDWFKACISSKDIKSILKNVGVDNIRTFIMADYRFIPMKQLMKFCERNGITYVVDIMDWFVAGTTINSKIKKIDNDLRMTRLYPKVKNRIYICNSYKKILGISSNTSIIPGVTDRNICKQIFTSSSREKIKLFFAGQPGERCEKEKIDWVIKAIHTKDLKDRFELSIAGVDMIEFVENNFELKEFIDENVNFLGRISHNQCIDLLIKSDFSLVIRPNNQLSNFGFSTKIGESFMYGIPVLATDTSDNKDYIVDGENGYVCACYYNAVWEMLKKISQLSLSEINNLKMNTLKKNPLYFENFIHEFRRVI